MLVVSREALPLTGVRVAVTRPAHAAAVLADALRAAGAEPLVVPLTQILPPLEDAPLRAAARHLDRYDWILFTSSNAVRAFRAVMHSRAIGSHTRIAVVGDATAGAVRSLLMRDPDVIPAMSGSAALVPALLAADSLHSARVLWPRADAADPRLARAVRSAGAILDAPVAYRTECLADAARELASLDQQRAVDTITFTAPSAVDCYATALTGDTRCVVAVIGSTTAAAARARGIPVQVEPRESIIPALVAALARHYTETPG